VIVVVVVVVLVMMVVDGYASGGSVAGSAKFACGGGIVRRDNFCALQVLTRVHHACNKDSLLSRTSKGPTSTCYDQVIIDFKLRFLLILIAVCECLSIVLVLV
jgi:hypothetical protein